MSFSFSFTLCISSHIDIRRVFTPWQCIPDDDDDDDDDYDDDDDDDSDYDDNNDILEVEAVAILLVWTTCAV